MSLLTQYSFSDWMPISHQGLWVQLLFSSEHMIQSTFDRCKDNLQCQITIYISASLCYWKCLGQIHILYLSIVYMFLDVLAHDACLWSRLGNCNTELYKWTRHVWATADRTECVVTEVWWSGSLVSFADEVGTSSQSKLRSSSTPTAVLHWANNTSLSCTFSHTNTLSLAIIHLYFPYRDQCTYFNFNST